MKIFQKKLFLWLCLVFLSLSPVSSVGAKSTPSQVMDGKEALQLLIRNNTLFQNTSQNTADISVQKRQHTTTNGQNPYAVVITCADSRVPPEHIFSAGIGELFVIRNAGNIIGSHEIGSIEYAVEHLHVKLILVLGHTHCGAVGAALLAQQDSKQSSHLHNLVHYIHKGVQKEKDPRKAEKTNVLRSMRNIFADPTLQKLIEENAVLVQGGLYSIDSGAVEFFSSNNEQ